MDEAAPRSEELFAAARALPGEQREAFVRREAGDDHDLAEEVLSLLRHDTPTEDLLALQARAAAAELVRSDEHAASRAIHAHAEEPAPSQIGRYRVIRELGRGGFGRVYLAEQDEPHRLVALKVAHAQASPTDRRRFRAEGVALARLQHPGIARVYDAGVWHECADRPYIVMEYIEGLALDDYAAAHRLSRRRRMALLAQVCDAVAHAHRRGVIHRDLAPKNILVGEDGIPRILDFGVARLLNAGVAAVTLARDGASLVGTLGYMSPEQLSGDPLLMDTRTDVYALGVIAFELLTGRRFLDVSTLSLTAALEAARTAPAVRPSSVDRSLRGDLDAIVLHATERDPERRYPSANALGTDIRRWLHDEPVAARRPSPLYRARKFALRHRAATAAGVILAVGLTVAAGYTMDARRAERRSLAASLNALEAIVTRILSPLASKLGSLDERAELLAIIGPDVERIAAESPDSLMAQRIRARYLSALSDVQDDRGALAAAMSSREESLEVYRRLLAVWPNDIETAHECSLAIVRYGNLLASENRAAEVQALYEEALALDEDQVRRHPEDLRLLSNLYWSYRRLDELHRAADPARSRGLAQEAASVAERMSAIAPGAWRTLEANIESDRRLSELAMAEADFEEAERHGRAALETAHRLIVMDPLSRHIQTRLALAYNAAIRPLIATGALEKADQLVAEGAVSLRFIMTEDFEPAQRLVIERMLLELRLSVADARGDDLALLRLLDEAVVLSQRLMETLPGELPQREWRAGLLLGRMESLNCLDRNAERLSDFARVLEHADDTQALFANSPRAIGRADNWRQIALRKLEGRLTDDLVIRAEPTPLTSR